MYESEQITSQQLTNFLKKAGDTKGGPRFELIPQQNKCKCEWRNLVDPVSVYLSMKCMHLNELFHYQLECACILYSDIKCIMESILNLEANHL